MGTTKPKKPGKPKKELPPEPMFAVAITLRASLLGGLLAHLDNKAEELDVKIIKTVSPGGNLPKGAFKKAAIEILIKAGGQLTIALFKERMEAVGFTNATVATQLYGKSAKKFITRKGEVVHLNKGVK